MLIDQYGQPIKKAVLKEEISAPSVTGVRSVISGHPAQGLTPSRLASILRSAENGDATAYFELAEEMEEKDPRYLPVLNTRKNQVSQLDITVKAASDDPNDLANAELVEQFLDRDELQSELFDILDAIGKSCSFTEIIWDTSEGQWMPQRLEWRDPRFFEFDRVDGRTPLLKETDGSQPLPPFKFITHYAKVKSGLPIRGGLARAVSWWYLFRNYGVKNWITFMEVYGQPLRVGKFGPDATEDEKSVLLRALSDIGTDAAAMIPESMVIEFIKAEGTSASSALYKDLCDYIDKLITQMVLGQNLTTDVQEGSRAAATVHDCVREDIERADATSLSATLNRDLVYPIVTLNRGRQKRYPKILIGRPDMVDVVQFVNSAEKLAKLGLPIATRTIYEKTGIDKPEDGDELLVIPASSAPPSSTTEPLASPIPDTARANSAGCGCGNHHLVTANSDELDDLDRLARQTGDLIEPDTDDWLNRIRRMLEQAEDLQQARDQLLPLIQQMDQAGFADRLREASVLADLFGQDEDNGTGVEKA